MFETQVKHLSNTEFRKGMKKNIKWSKRTKVRLGSDELQQLKDYVENEPASYTNIKLNTGISFQTINNIIQNGSTELHVAIRLRDFLKAIKQPTY